MNEKEILTKNIRSYDEMLEHYGPDSPMAGKTSTRRSQYFRFKILLEIGPILDSKDVVLEYGCGVGDMLEYLEFQGFKGTYIGVDINKKIIAEAKKKHPGASFLVLGKSIPANDYVFISSVFNERLHNDRKAHVALIHKAIKDAFKSARKGVAINGISIYAREYVRTSWYINPFDLAKWCMENVTNQVTVRHDYRGGNYTIYLYKNHSVDF